MGWKTGCCTAGVLLALATSAARAAPEPTADGVVQAMTDEVLAAVRAEPALRSGDTGAVNALVDRLVMPNVDIARLTSLAMGRYWRTASEEQQRRLQDEFKTLIVRSYTGALTHVSAAQSVQMRPLRAGPADTDVVVSSDIRGEGEPIRIDYRMRRDQSGWKIYDVSVLGVWLAENYRGSFAEEIGRSGIEGLIARLHSRNQGAAVAVERSAR